MKDSSVKQRFLSLSVSRNGKLVPDLSVDDAQGVHINAVLALAKVGDVINIEICEREVSQFPLMTNFNPNQDKA